METEKGQAKQKFKLKYVHTYTLCDKDYSATCLIWDTCNSHDYQKLKPC